MYFLPSPFFFHFIRDLQAEFYVNLWYDLRRKG